MAAAALAGVLAVYVDTLRYGLFADDYLALRPWTLGEIARTFHGTWEPSGVLPAFFRPLAVLYQAGIFAIFGLNVEALHGISLLEMAAAAWMLARFVERETASTSLGALAALLLAGHPAIGRSEGPWFIFQYQTLTSLALAASLLLWLRRRDRPTVHNWSPILLLSLAGCLIKEDMAMVVPALVLLQWIRASALVDVPIPSRPLLIAAAVLPLAVLAARQVILGSAGGVFWPASDTVLNLIRGPARVLILFQPSDWPVNQAASALVVAGTAVGLWYLRGAGLVRERALVLTGAVLLAVLDLPLVAFSSAARFRLLAMCGVLIITGAFGALRRAWSGVPGSRWRWMAAVSLTVVAIGAAGRETMAVVRPCGPESLEADGEVPTWQPIPPELRAWVQQKVAACAAGTYRPIEDTIDSIVWNTERFDGSAEDPGRVAHRFVIAVNQLASAASFDVRLATAHESSLGVRVKAAGAAAQRATVSAGWQAITVPLAPNVWSRLRSVHRIDIEVDGPPSGVIELGDVRLRRD